MGFLNSHFRKALLSYVAALAALFLISSFAFRSGAAAGNKTKAQESTPPAQESAQPGQPGDQPEAPPSAPDEPQAPVFENTIPPDKLAFLNGFTGIAAANLLRDKQFTKLIGNVVPNTPIHVNYDRPLTDALEMGLSSPGDPTQIRDGRYVMISSKGSPQRPFRGFVWIDMQEGIALAGIWFHPSNGEPSPSLTIFSKELHEKTLAMSDLPVGFEKDLSGWEGTTSSMMPTATTYFINASGKKYALEHDQDFCTPIDDSFAPPQDVCEKMNADAADNDMTGAYFMKETDHASNATAYMLDQDQAVWIQMRDTTCRNGPDPVACHITMTRERTRVIVGRPPAPPRSTPTPRPTAPRSAPK